MKAPVGLWKASKVNIWSAQRRALSITRHLDNNASGGVSTSTSTKEGPALPADLYMHPERWKGLPPQKILELYWERMARLGSEYKPNKDELNALLATSEFSNVSINDIKNLYYGGEQGAIDVKGGSANRDNSLRPFMFDELPSQAQELVAQHREQRFYNRLAAYELPLLAQYRQEYKRPSPKTHPVTYRYTNYVGEEHPNSRKVVLSVKTENLGLEPKSLHKFKVLATSRYDHTTDIFKMSSDKFEHASQNARYLHDILQKLLTESKNLAEDDFNDVPIDTRHTIAKNLRKKKHNYKFPEHWKRPEDAPKKNFDVVDQLLSTLQ
ncbi:Rsm24p [Saccharomyces cerevisiae x Saccharomyces kudriavzevii VIN7]|uniref:Small ribosomal subunit protein mS35 n=1 Tax=Saccharomyces cerevisiae x Saccharomyces kudriavzevii (strain VIN7) TaxID=1095631 RepID=H0GSU9_SACCK|nr:Rsm24p [Saccharomyces cerevisiae x Saccharomyces kudriavzevii VIN7]